MGVLYRRAWRLSNFILKILKIVLGTKWRHNKYEIYIFDIKTMYPELSVLFSQIRLSLKHHRC